MSEKLDLASADSRTPEPAVALRKSSRDRRTVRHASGAKETTGNRAMKVAHDYLKGVFESPGAAAEGEGEGEGGGER